MTRSHRYFAMVGGLALAACLAACGSAGVTGSTAAGGAATGKDSPGPTMSSQASPGPTDGRSAVASPRVTFTLAEGAHRDICGIRVRVAFIPPSVTATQSDQAFLVGGPITSAPDVPDPTAGDQPLPSTVAPARAGEATTVMGKRFRVHVVDVPHRRVELEALC